MAEEGRGGPPGHAGTGPVNVFELRDRAVEDYAAYVRGFLTIKDPGVATVVEEALAAGALWPEPWVSLNPSFERGGQVDQLVQRGLLHPQCGRIFRAKSPDDPVGRGMALYTHQVEAIEAARTGESYVVTTGTGSGKSLTYLVPIVDWVLRNCPGRGRLSAIVVYPMNALANSQYEELAKFLRLGYPDGEGPVRFARYTGQESDDERRAIMADPPDILLTNYVMAELILTRVEERPLVRQAKGLQFWSSTSCTPTEGAREPTSLYCCAGCGRPARPPPSSAWGPRPPWPAPGRPSSGPGPLPPPADCSAPRSAPNGW